MYKMEWEPNFEIVTEVVPEDPRRVLVYLKGRISHFEVRRFRSEIDRLLLMGFRTFDMDLSELFYIGSAALAEFMAVAKAIHEKGGDLCIVHPRKLVRHIMVSAHLNDYIQIGPT